VPWEFVAKLTNPTPPGQIQTRGTFGPWQADDPASTPLTGQYTFKDADLGVFKGIGGILTSDGKFGGVLQRIDIDGRATVPDFKLTIGGRPVPLETRFHSVVDGTNGNTWLNPVDAKLGDSPIHAEGGVVEETGQDGRTIALDVLMDKARIEDVLRLALKPSAKPPMTGRLQLKTKLRIPPGEPDVIERMGLDGSFEIATARFESLDVQGKINELSRRARGKLDQPAQRVVSNMKGRYVMKDGIIRFSSVSFDIPGAAVRLAGTYGMRHEQLDFVGTVSLEAKPSEMVTGFKSVLLKAVDPLLRRKDRTVIPVVIEGTVADPKFKLDIKKALLRR
jgi:AsmA-like C-terminal region